MSPAEQIAEVLWAYFEHVRKHEGYIVDGVDGDRAAALVVEALGLREEFTWSWPENLTGTGQPGYGFSVATEVEARAEADSWMSIVRRWVSGWSVVGGEPSEGTLGVVDMDFCDCNRTLGGDQ